MGRVAPDFTEDSPRYTDPMRIDRLIRSAGVAAATLFIVTGGVLAGRAIVEVPGSGSGHDDAAEYDVAAESPFATLDVDDLLSPFPTFETDVVDDDFLASPSPEASPEPSASPDSTFDDDASPGPEASPSADASPAEDASAEPTESFDDDDGNSGPGSRNSGHGSGDDDDADDGGRSGPGSANSGPGSASSGSGSDDD